MSGPSTVNALHKKLYLGELCSGKSSYFFKGAVIKYESEEKMLILFERIGRTGEREEPKHGAASMNLQNLGISKVYLIVGGAGDRRLHESFSFWMDPNDVAEIKMKDKAWRKALLMRKDMASLRQSTSPLGQLQNRPLPDGVNPTSLEELQEPQCGTNVCPDAWSSTTSGSPLENTLKISTIQDVFGMETEEFLNLRSWKKEKLKQHAGLF